MYKFLQKCNNSFASAVNLVHGTDDYSQTKLVLIELGQMYVVILSDMI